MPDRPRQSLEVRRHGSELGSFTDSERPYRTGAIGLYTEDAHVHVDSVNVAG